jgi:hypothetical protein
MLTLPAECASAILLFQSLFSKRAWQYAETLLVGAILAPAQRTVSAVLRVMGLSQEEHFQNYHRLLNRAQWSLCQGARQLLAALIDQFVPSGVVLIALDDTLERRRGRKIQAKGIYRDAVRSSKSHFAKASGLRWLCLMLLSEMPFSQRRWALPILTRLSPSERYSTDRRRRHKTLTDQARGVLLQLRRWLPRREIVCVCDSSFAALELLDAVRRELTIITRLRLDAAIYEPAPERTAATKGRPRVKGKKLPTLKQLLSDPEQVWTALLLKRWYQQNDRMVEVLTGTAVWYHSGMAVVPIRWVLVRDPEGKFPPTGLLSTDLKLTPEEILGYYVGRWQVEVTFEESRQYLGVESQRQWSDKAIERSTPIVLAIYSIVALMATSMASVDALKPRESAWYVKEHITFSDALAAVRQALWRSQGFSMSSSDSDIAKIPRPLLQRLFDTLCYGS